jgi:hypothetical protein
MIDELLRIYDESRLNRGQPESLVNPTLIFNEGWLLRAVLRQWKLAPGESGLPFLPFPADAKIFSEGQLSSPFASRQRGDKLAEAHTHVDGIVGHFSIGATKSGIQVDADCRYLAVFEAKLYSPISGGISHAPGYDQVSRTVGCVINSLLRAGCPGPDAAHVVVLYPADHTGINPARYDKSHLERQIAARVEGFGLPATSTFARGWRATLGAVQLSFVTWEEVLATIGNDLLNQFYQHCRRFNR